MKLSYDENYYNDIRYCRELREYQLKKIVDNQTIYMGFQEMELDCGQFVKNSTKYYNVFLTIYNKQKDMYINMDKQAITGRDPIRDFIICRKMFDALDKCAEREVEE